MINTIVPLITMGGSAGFQGSVRSVYPLTGAALQQVRCTHWGGGSLVVPHWSIGVYAGGQADTKAIPVELLIGGTSGFTSGSTVTPIVSDWVNLTGFLATDFLVVIVDNTAGNIPYSSTPPAGAASAYAGGTSSWNSATTPAGSGYATGFVYNTCQIDAQGPDTWTTLYKWNMS
jgi:hypothetical protein